MEESKRIRVVFKDDHILSETQKSEGLNRSWVQLKPHQQATVSDVASHLLHVFQLHQSCPHGLLLSMSGFVLPPFESTCILKDNEIIRVRKKQDVLSIEGNNAANAVEKVKAAEKQPMHGGVLLLANEEFEKERGGYESDDTEEEDEDPLEEMENSGRNADPKNRKRKASEKLKGSKMKKQCFKAPGIVANDSHIEKTENPHHGGRVHVKQRSLSQKKKNTDSDVEDSMENNEECPTLHDKSDGPLPGMKQNTEVQEGGKATEGDKIAPKETKKVPSRSARRKYAKRRWMREMANIQKKNAACESEGLRNWKEDRAKAERNKLDSQLKGVQKWKKHQASAERTVVDGQPKGLLHWNQLPQNNSRDGKKRQHRNQPGWLFGHSNQNGDLQKKPNQNGNVHEQITQNDSDVPEQPTKNNSDVQEQPTKNNSDTQEQPNQSGDALKQSNQESDEEREVVPIVIRPGHIRFEPFEKEQAVQLNHGTLETFQWNGITSKKKGQKWGMANSSFTPRNDYKNSSKECSEILITNKKGEQSDGGIDFDKLPECSEILITNKKGEQSDGGIDFDKLPTLPSMPKEGDLIAYRILELSSSWTPELSAYRVGKVSSYNAESNQTILVPVPEYPIVLKKADEDEAIPLDNSLYKEDCSLEIDFSALVDVRSLKDGSSGPENVVTSGVSESPVGNKNTSKKVLPSINNEQTVALSSTETGELNQGEETHIPAADGGLNIWDQISDALNSKKEQLSQESGWGKNPKKLQLVERNSFVKNAKKVQPSQENSWGKNARKAQPSQESGWDKQSSGGKSWSYKALRGSALGPTMAILRSKKEI